MRTHHQLRLYRKQLSESKEAKKEKSHYDSGTKEIEAKCTTLTESDILTVAIALPAYIGLLNVFSSTIYATALKTTNTMPITINTSWTSERGDELIRAPNLGIKFFPMLDDGARMCVYFEAIDWTDLAIFSARLCWSDCILIEGLTIKISYNYKSCLHRCSESEWSWDQRFWKQRLQHLMHSVPSGAETPKRFINEK